jgi:hypothetical protein
MKETTRAGVVRAGAWERGRAARDRRLGALADDVVRACLDAGRAPREAVRAAVERQLAEVRPRA